METEPTRKRLLRPLLGRLYSTDPRERWGAVRDLGIHARELRDPARVRNVLRRLAWSLNEESGASGWGAPEAMGEILFQVPELRPEFEGHFLAYLSGEETFLDHPTLDAGTLWALARLGRGDRFDEAAHVAAVRPFLTHPDPAVGGLAAWCAWRLALAALATGIAARAEVPGRFWVLLDGEIVPLTAAELLRAGESHGDFAGNAEPRVL